MHRSNARARVRRRVRPSSVAWLLAATLAVPVVARAQDMTDTTFKIRYKGLTLTPIGYFAGEAVFRAHNEVADIASSFNSIPFSHTTNDELTEFRGSARQSRIGLAAEGVADGVKLNGYWESDFLSSGTNSNSNQSNSYVLRIRQFWGGATLASGTTFDAGQMWSLMTQAKNGVLPRGEAVPLTIDAQYNVGFDWARQWGLRLAQDLVPHKAAIALGIEESQMTVGGHNLPSEAYYGASGGNLLNNTTTYSNDLTPDVIAKIAIDPGFGHWEIKALGTTFRDRVVDPTCTLSQRCSFDAVRTAGGVGAGVWFPFMYEGRDVFDFGLSGLWGSGIGRYGTGGLTDATVRPDGTIQPIKAAHGLLSLEAHPTKKLDIFVYGGTEYEYRDYFITGTAAKPTYDGYGSPLANNSGCDTETKLTSNTAVGPATNCTGDTRDLWEASVGFWYSFIRGPYGRFAWGLEYHYVSKNTWSGLDGIQPQAIDPMVFTSFRYYIP